MATRSMTGFARVDGHHPGLRWTWELRSVNGKGLDIRVRVPPGFDAVEFGARERTAKRLSRGNCALTLTIEREVGANRYRVNDEVLTALLAAMNTVADRIVAAPPRLDGILAFKGVLEADEQDETPEARAAVEAAVLASFEQALDALVAARRQEGLALAGILCGHIDAIERLAAAVEAHPARRPEAIRARLAEQVRQLTEATSSLDPQRLHQEAVLLATRADIREELDRLAAHVGQARALLGEDAPVGRRLDFLTQEFNREVNTLCSKSNDSGLTAIGLELKAVVDQLREQIQNVE